MKRINIISVIIVITAVLITSCNNLLDVDSERYVFDNEYDLTATNDSLYSLFGLFTQLEKISDDYFLLGEVRADLVDVTENSGEALKQINEFRIQRDNKYICIDDYYSVINNCNYIISKLDTSVTRGGQKVMLKTYAAVKAIRAWTYIQIALNFNKAIYFKQPLLTIQESLRAYPEYSLSELAPILIEDLLPWKDIQYPQPGTVHSYSFRNSFFPIRFILGDLYLWTGKYTEAATEYHDLMFKEGYIINPNYRSNRQVINGAFTGVKNFVWDGVFLNSSPENITSIVSSNQYQYRFDLDSIIYNYQVKASDKAIDNWNSQTYIYSNTLDTIGDLRLDASVKGNLKIERNGYIGVEPETNTKNYIFKYFFINPTANIAKQVMPYRVSLLYLRYAEAVNRMGKPHLAMAVLKSGLNRLNINNRNIVPEKEKSTPLQNFMDFTDARFDNNIGIRSRGLGNTSIDTTHYVIPRGVDTTEYVEDLILNELALENAFEGNRYHDIMRIAIRRDDNMYLASKIAAKHKSDSITISTRLSNRERWYIRF